LEALFGHANYSTDKSQPDKALKLARRGVYHGADFRCGSKAEKVNASIRFPLFTGGLNRSMQHFILKERWSVI
jgi:hypothetical protein